MEAARGGARQQQQQRAAGPRASPAQLHASRLRLLLVPVARRTVAVQARQQRSSSSSRQYHDDFGELEDLVDARGELLYNPESPATSSSSSWAASAPPARGSRRSPASALASSSRPGSPVGDGSTYYYQRRTGTAKAKKDKGAYDLARLLDVWDKAVARRTMKLLSSRPRSVLDNNSAGRNSSNGGGDQEVAASATQASAAMGQQGQQQGQQQQQQRRRGEKWGPYQAQELQLLKRHKQPGLNDDLHPDLDGDGDEGGDSSKKEEEEEREGWWASSGAGAGGGGSGGGAEGRGKGAWKFTVTDVLSHVDGNPRPPLEHLGMDEVVGQAKQLVLHNALSALGTAGDASGAERLLQHIMQAKRHTTYTWGVGFMAFSAANRMDLVMSYFDQACRAGEDVGPVGASCLIKIASQQRNLELALDLYYKMRAARTTFNRYTYNCLIHLCGVLARCDDALDILTHMQSEAQQNLDCLPDTYTFSGVIYTISSAKRWEHLNNIFFTVLETRTQVDAEVWCQLISGAGRAGRIDWAANYWKAYKRYCEPNIGVVNAYLWALSRADECLVDQALTIYRAMPEQKLVPDSYTYVAMLSLMAKGGCELAHLEALVRDVRSHHLQLNTQLGTALINAYRRTHELVSGDPYMVEGILAQVDRIMGEMVQRRLATSQTFTTLAMLYIAVGRFSAVPYVLNDAKRAGCWLDSNCYHHLYVMSSEMGQVDMANQFMTVRKQLKFQEWQLRKRSKAKGRRPPGAY